MAEPVSELDQARSRVAAAQAVLADASVPGAKPAPKSLPEANWPDMIKAMDNPDLSKVAPDIAPTLETNPDLSKLAPDILRMAEQSRPEPGFLPEWAEVLIQDVKNLPSDIGEAVLQIGEALGGERQEREIPQLPAQVPTAVMAGGQGPVKIDLSRQRMPSPQSIGAIPTARPVPPQLPTSIPHATNIPQLPTAMPTAASPGMPSMPFQFPTAANAVHATPSPAGAAQQNNPELLAAVKELQGLLKELIAAVKSQPRQAGGGKATAAAQPIKGGNPKATFDLLKQAVANSGNAMLARQSGSPVARSGPAVPGGAAMGAGVIPGAVQPAATGASASAQRQT